MRLDTEEITTLELENGKIYLHTPRRQITSALSSLPEGCSFLAPKLGYRGKVEFKRVEQGEIQVFDDITYLGVLEWS